MDVTTQHLLQIVSRAQVHRDPLPIRSQKSKTRCSGSAYQTIQARRDVANLHTNKDIKQLVKGVAWTVVATPYDEMQPLHHAGNAPVGRLFCVQHSCPWLLSTNAACTHLPRGALTTQRCSPAYVGTFCSILAAGAGVLMPVNTSKLRLLNHCGPKPCNTASRGCYTTITYSR